PLNVVLKQHSGRPEEERPLDVFGEWTSPLKEGQHKPQECNGSAQPLKGDAAVPSPIRASRHHARPQSCPPRAKGSVMSGPWSLE
ncbi:hypothetical protein A2U01_0086611, partial [Trifolium medium]|nr:hypothetical protein [Trifolium medium]